MLGITLLLLGAGLGAYTLFGYPLLLVMARHLRKHAPLGELAPDPDASHPRISITVPVFNEAHQLEELLESLVALEYPTDLRQILIVSDGSTDGSDDIVRSWADRGVELLRVEERRGKCAAENAARPHLTGEVVVNTDASVRIHPGALGSLLEPFRDPRVGVASGRDVSVGKDAGDANHGEARYVGYEMWVRDLETAVGGIVGASGSLYATRARLHALEIPPELSRDFAAALVAMDHGLAAVSVPGALCHVPRTHSLRREYRRKVRTVARGMTTLWAWRHLLNPLAHPGTAWKLWSHKVLRWMLPLALVLVLAGAALLAPSHRWALVLLVAGVAGILAGAVGWILAPRDETRPIPRVLATPAFILMGNVAVVHALVRALRGRSESLWEPTRRASTATSEGEQAAGG